MVSSDWKVKSISDICINFDAKRIPISSIERNSRKGSYPYYGAQGIIDYIDDYIFEGEYLLIAEDGANLETRNQDICMLTPKGHKFWVNNHAHILKSNHLSDIRYIKYFLNSFNIAPYITGSAQPKLNQENLGKITLLLPSVREQKAIANILSSLDDKIELNNKINKNLEEIAQTLYKRWFVDFEFPNENGEPYKSSGGEMVDSELGLIPKGWEVKEINLVIKNKKERVGLKIMPVLSAVKEGKLVLSSDFFTKNVPSNNISKYLIVSPREFSYNPARINIGSIGMNEFDFNGCVSPIYVVLKPDYIYVNFFSLYFKTSTFSDEVSLRASGSVRQSLNFDDLGRIKIVYPSKDSVIKFNEIYDSIYFGVKSNEKQIANLSKIRDELLPKLMSGEIEVPVEE